MSRFLMVHCVYTFSAALAPWRNFTRCKIHFAYKFYVLLYWQRYCTALQQRALAKLCGLEKRVPPIFGRAAITFGIGPHSSWFYTVEHKNVSVNLCQ